MLTLNSLSIRSKRALLAGLICAGLSCSSLAQDKFPRVKDVEKPSAQDRTITRIVSRYLQEGHLSHTRLNDELSQRAFDQFFRMLDPMKMYFLQSDIYEFKEYATKLDDMTKAETLHSLTRFSSDTPSVWIR